MSFSSVVSLKSVFVNTSTGSMPFSSAAAMVLSMMRVLGCGSQTEDTTNSLSRFASGGRTRKFLRGKISCT